MQRVTGGRVAATTGVTHLKKLAAELAARDVIVREHYVDARVPHLHAEVIRTGRGLLVHIDDVAGAPGSRSVAN